MDITNIMAFAAVAILLVISPGPNGLLIAKTVPLLGKKAGFANVWGFVAAFYLHGTLSVFGISILLLQSAHAFFVFKILGAIYLIWVGVKSLLGAFEHEHTALPTPGAKNTATPNAISLRAAFVEGFVTNALNPKVTLFYLAAFPQFLSVDDSALNAYALVTAHTVLNFCWFSLMVMMFSRISRAVGGSSFRRWLSALTGIAFIGFGSKLALLKNDN